MVKKSVKIILLITAIFLTYQIISMPKWKLLNMDITETYFTEYMDEYNGFTGMEKKEVLNLLTKRSRVWKFEPGFKPLASYEQLILAYPELEPKDKETAYFFWVKFNKESSHGRVLIFDENDILIKEPMIAQ